MGRYRYVLSSDDDGSEVFRHGVYIRRMSPSRKATLSQKAHGIGGTNAYRYVIPDIQFRSLWASLALRWDVFGLSPLPRFGQLDHDRRMGEG